MTFYDAFAGIGGFRLGLERSGFKCIGSCEIDEKARKVYYSRFGDWPDGDIKAVKSINGAYILCGGFPCQDVSIAGAREGIEGQRTGLWKELVRLVTNCNPRWCIFENVPGLLTKGFTTVLNDLASIGYDAEWESISAASFGAPHVRDRIWIVAYPNGGRFHNVESSSKAQQHTLSKLAPSHETFWTQTKPPFCGMDDGLWRKSYGDQFRLLGNSVVPQIVEFVGRRIMEIENAKP